MNITFHTPDGAVVGLAILLPLFVLFLATRQNHLIAKRLGLTTISGRVWFADFVQRILRKKSERIGSKAPAWVGRGAVLLSVGILAGIAASQPAVSFPQRTEICSGAEVVMVFDTSRSMIARTSSESLTRLQRARAIAKRMRQSIECVPVGIASWTDRALPHLFPTSDSEAFVSVTDSVIGIEQPPPSREGAALSTDLLALRVFAEADFFTPKTEDKKILVVFTDGEAVYYAPQVLANMFRKADIQIMFVHVWGPHERVFTPEGKPEIYRSDPVAVGQFKNFARVTKSPLFSENDEAQAVSELSKKIGDVMRSSAEAKPREILLAPYCIALAILLCAFLLSRNINTVLSALRRRGQKM